MALDLRTDQLEKHWKAKDKRGRLNNILSLMDNIEHWTVDDNESIVKTLMDLSVAFENVLNLNPIFKENKDTILYIMAYISSSRAIRLYEWFGKNSKYKEFSDELIAYANDHIDEPVYAIFIERLNTFKKANLLYSIFATERINKILLILSKNSIE